MSTPRGTGPHDGQPVRTAGVAVERARGAAIFVHGRGADARDILGLSALVNPGRIAYAAPEAAGHTWYPNSFLAPIGTNEPGISSGLRVIAALCDGFAGAGIPPERLLLLGFSQGACLILEFVARNPRRYGGVAGLSGGLIGPPGTARDYAGTLDGTPVFMGCDHGDPHIPRERFLETADVLRRMDADVTDRLYPDLGHGINEEEIEAVRRMLRTLAA